MMFSIFEVRKFLIGNELIHTLYATSAKIIDRCKHFFIKLENRQ